MIKNYKLENDEKNCCRKISVKMSNSEKYSWKIEVKMCELKIGGEKSFHHAVIAGHDYHDLVLRQQGRKF